MKDIRLKTTFSFFILLLAGTSVSQNITNTLGTNGIFSVTNGTTALFSVLQSTGQVRIANTLRLEHTNSSTQGVLYLGSHSFMHTMGGSNTFLGEFAGNFTMTTQFNTGIGNGSLSSLTSGSYNSALGFGSLSANTSGKDNAAGGFGALRFNTTGNYNSAFGSLSLRNNITGSYNSAFGYWSMLSNVSGIENCAFGTSALGGNTTGSWNSAFGSDALKQATVNFNTAIGFFAGTNVTTGSGVVCIGFNSQPSSGNAVNQLTLGNNQVTSLRCAVTSITSLSDARDKKNIRDLELGINFLMKIKARTFNWDKREWYENNVSDGTKMQTAPTAGFIAQELDEAQSDAGAEWLNLVLKENPDKWEAMAGNLLPVIVKSLQELKLENERLKSINTGLKEKNRKITDLMSKLTLIQQSMPDETGSKSITNIETEARVTERSDPK
jgi:hypothetical protein